MVLTMEAESNEKSHDESKSFDEQNNEEKIEVNFDVNPTKLYNYIQQRKWKAALDQLRHDRSESWTWVYRMDKEDSKKMRWRILPIHAALLFKSDSSLIKGLLEAYPIGVQMADDQGMIPMHLAFRNKTSESIINLLLTRYPESIKVKDRKGRLPTDFISTKDEGGCSMRQHFISQIQRKKMELSEMEEETKGLQNQLKRATKKIETFERKMGTSSESFDDLDERDPGKEEIMAEEISALNEQIETMQSQIESLSLKKKGETTNHALQMESLKTEHEAKEKEQQETIHKLSEKNDEGTEQVKRLEMELAAGVDTDLHDTYKANIDKLISMIHKLQPPESKKLEEYETLEDKMKMALSVLVEAPNQQEFKEVTESKEALSKQVMETKKEYENQLKTTKESLETQLDEANDEKKQMKKTIEQLEQSTAIQSDEKQKLRDQVSSLNIEKVEAEQKLQELQTSYNGSDTQILKEQIETVMKEYQASKETIQKQLDLIQRLKGTIANERAKPKLSSPLKKIPISTSEEAGSTDVKPVESLLDFSKTQIEEIMKVNKSYEDGAFKSAERYKILKDLYDSTMKKLKSANEMTASLQRQLEDEKSKYQKQLEDDKRKIYEQMEEEKQKLNEWENMYKTMKQKFEAGQKELIREYDYEHMEKNKELEEASRVILELEEALAEEELSKETLLKNFINVEESVVKLAGEHDEQDKEYVETIANITSENESLQRELGSLEGELDAFKTKLGLARNELTSIKKKMEKGENDRMDLMKGKTSLESKMREFEQIIRKEKRSQDRLKVQIERHDEILEMKKQDHEHEKQKQAKIISKLTDLTEKLEKQLAEENIKNGSHIGKIEVERGELQDDLRGVLDELDEKQQMIDDLRIELQNEKQSISKLESELDHLKVALMRDDQNKNEEYAEIESKIDELHRHNEELENRLAAMKVQYESEINSLEKNLDAEIDKRASLTDEIKTIEKAVIAEAQQHEKEINEYKDMIDTADEQKEELRNMIVLLERELEKTGST